MKISRIFYILSIALIVTGVIKMALGDLHEGITWQMWGLLVSIKARQLEDDE